MTQNVIRRKSVIATFTPYLLIAPALILYLTFTAYPILYGIWLSLLDWDGFSQNMIFVSFRNFSEIILHDQLFRLSLWHNVIYTLGTVMAKTIVGLGLALLLNRSTKMLVVYRTAIFIPVILSFVVVGMMWSWILNPIFGLANALFKTLGLGFLAQDWLGNPRLALYTVMFVDLWKWAGFHMVLFLAGLKGIPEVLYEAAAIDGATPWQRTIRITVPLLSTPAFMGAALAIIGGFGVFDLVYVLTSGGPYNATEVVAHHMYLQTFKFRRVGYGAAMAWILFLIILPLVITQVRSMLRNIQEASG